MDNWLLKRLTPIKAAQTRWSELSSAIEDVWGEDFDPYLSRLERLRSFYEADDEDLARKHCKLKKTPC